MNLCTLMGYLGWDCGSIPDGVKLTAAVVDRL